MAVVVFLLLNTIQYNSSVSHTNRPMMVCLGCKALFVTVETQIGLPVYCLNKCQQRVNSQYTVNDETLATDRRFKTFFLMSKKMLQQQK